MSLDGGSWDTASLLLPRPDPVHRELFGGTEKELEAAVAYQEALRKLRRRAPGDPQAEQQDPKGKGKGKGKDPAPHGGGLGE